jgi:phosphate transport system substrate-binding protein
MSTRSGRCINFKNCPNADWHELVAVPGDTDFVCHLCGHRLKEQGIAAAIQVATPREAVAARKVATARTDAIAEVRKTVAPAPARKSSRVLVLATAISLFLVVLGLAGYAISGRLHSANATVSDRTRKTILRLAGSNTIGDELGPSLAAAFLKNEGATEVQILSGANPGEKIVQGILPGEHSLSFIEISAHGSATAFTALAENACDIGMASRRIKPEESAKLSALGDLGSASGEHVLGLDGIAVIVNSSNRLGQLDKDKIRRIFTGEVSNWSQVGSFQGPINVYARDDSSGTYDTFKNLVLNGKALTPAAQRIEDSQELSDAVAKDPNGIGFIGLPFIQNAKPVAVSERGTLPLLPTRLTVATEDYLLSRRLYLYTATNPSNKYTRKFVEFAISRQGQEVVGSGGFIAQNVVPIPLMVSDSAPAEYKMLTQNAERLSVDFRFQTGETVLDNKAQSDLDRVVSMIADRNQSGEKVMLFGFSDGNGSLEGNQELSLKRAKMIESELIERGLKPVLVRGYGSDLAVAADDSKEGLTKNRRVEIWVKN